MFRRKYKESKYLENEGERLGLNIDQVPFVAVVMIVALLIRNKK